MPTIRMRPRRPARAHRAAVRLAALALVAAGALAACSREQLLEVRTPDQIGPGDAATPAGAAALRAAALGNFSNFYSGTTNMGVTLYAGLLSDELINARPGADHLDQRAFNENIFPNVAWNNFGQAYTQLIRARRALRAFVAQTPARDLQIGNLHALSGYALTIAGELFCNGVPLSNADDAAPAFVIVSNAQMFEAALAQFDSALTLVGADAAQRSLARVGRARALLNLDRAADAAAAVAAGGDGAGSAAVPTGFAFNTEYSAVTLVNGVFDWMVNTANYGPADREGGNGLNFRTAGDPRVATSTTFRLGQDGSTPIYTIQGFPTGGTPVRLATGVEARLIEAEAALQAGDGAGAVAALDAVRADAAARAAWGIVAAGADPLPPLADPGTPDGRRDLLFRERAFWLYLTAHRPGDLRRLVRQYDRPATEVWPTGAYFKGGTYGTDQNITPSFAERNNAGWTGCANRNP